MDENENQTPEQNRQVRIYFSYEGKRRLDIAAMVKIENKFQWISFDHPKLNDPENETQWLIRHVDGIPKPWENDEGQLDWLEMFLNEKITSIWICCLDHSFVSAGRDSSFRNQNLVVVIENTEGEILENIPFSPESGNFGVIAKIKIQPAGNGFDTESLDQGILFPSMMDFNRQVISMRPEENGRIFQ